jgi:hypothetical protein
MGRLIATRAADHGLLGAAATAAAGQTQYPRSAHWDPPSVAQGNAGQAMMCAYLDQCFPGEGWDRVGHDHLTRAVRAAEERGVSSPSSFGGLSGMALAATMLAQDGRRYRRLRRTLDARLVPDVLSAARALAASPVGMPVSRFDLISGLSGMTTYLLSSSDSAQADLALKSAMQSLTTLGHPVDGLPRWYTPAHLMHDQGLADQYPYGNLNLGLAHGIPGPLAVLALCVLHGHESEGVRSTIHTFASLVMALRCDDQWGVNWPTVVDVRRLDGRDVAGSRCEPSRDAWCYGSPGVARALWLAGRALGDEAMQQLAIDAMVAVYRRPPAMRRIDSPTFCHGVAGLLQITIRFAAETGMPLFEDAAEELTGQVLASCDPGRLLGVANIEPAGNLVDQPGLLDGATGVGMALLAAGTGVEPAWDRLFALA